MGPRGPSPTRTRVTGLVRTLVAYLDLSRAVPDTAAAPIQARTEGVPGSIAASAWQFGRTGPAGAFPVHGSADPGSVSQPADQPVGDETLTEQMLAGKNIAILVANGFEEVEMTEPQRALLKAGAKPKVISPEQGLVNGWHGAAWGHYFPTDRHVGEVLAADFDLLVLPGGDRSVAKLAGNPHTRRIIGSFVDAGKGIAAFGKGVELLSLVERIKGRTVTGAESARPALEAAGAVWSDEAMVQDRFLLTAQSNEDMAELVDAMLRNFVAAVEQRKAAA